MEYFTHDVFQPLPRKESPPRRPAATPEHWPKGYEYEDEPEEEPGQEPEEVNDPPADIHHMAVPQTRERQARGNVDRTDTRPRDDYRSPYFSTSNWHNVGDPTDEVYPDEFNPDQPWNHHELKKSRSTSRNSSERQRDHILPRASYLRPYENGAMSTQPGPTSPYQAAEMGVWEPKGTCWDWDRQDFLMKEKEHFHWKRNSPARRGVTEQRSVQTGDKKPKTELPKTYKYRLPSRIWSPTRGRWVVTGPTNSVAKVDAKMKGGRARKRSPSPYAAWEQDRFLQQDMEYLEEIQANNNAQLTDQHVTGASV